MKPRLIAHIVEEKSQSAHFTHADGINLYREIIMPLYIKRVLEVRQKMENVEREVGLYI